MDIVAVDKTWVDLVLRVPRLPGHDQKVLGTPAGWLPGGQGANVVCAAARLGLRAGFIGAVGGDTNGRLVIDDFARFGVDTHHLTIRPGTQTNFTVAMIDGSGEKALVVVPTTWDELALDATLAGYIQGARILYTTLYDRDQFARLAAAAHAAATLVAVDIEPVMGLDPADLRAVLRQVDIAFLNRESADAALPGTDPAAAARTMQGWGPGLVAITCGAQGAVACSSVAEAAHPGYPAAVVDTTGAGDCFCAAFLAGHCWGWPLDEILAFANAAAACSVSALGARGALPTPAQVRAFQAAASSHQDRT
jgi:sugar/nucleoside kinase (ribokinase family)